MTNVIDTQLQFVAILGQGTRTAHDAGIVDEYVQLVLFLNETNWIFLNSRSV